MRKSISIYAAAVLMIGMSAMAHLPTMGNGQFGSIENAFHIHDIDVSLVVYEEFRAPEDQLWMEFEAEAGQEVLFSLGLPQLESTREIRTSIALLGPGLPEISLPFEIPAGLGGVLYETKDVETPEEFYEPFADTQNWVLGEWRYSIPETGKYYFVTFSPEGKLGKYWVVTGFLEEFGADAFSQMPGWIRDVRAYHEVEGPAAWQRWMNLILAAVAGLGFWFFFLRK